MTDKQFKDKGKISSLTINQGVPIFDLSTFAVKYAELQQIQDLISTNIVANNARVFFAKWRLNGDYSASDMVDGATGLTGLNGGYLAAGQVVLRYHATLNTQLNGLWEVQSAGSAVRYSKANTADLLYKCLVMVQAGTYSGEYYICPNFATNFEVDAVNFTQVYLPDQNIVSLPNRKYIGVGCDFETVQAAVTWFNASATSNMEFIVDAGIHLVTDTITVNNSSYKLKIRGAGFNITYLNASTGLLTKPMFVLNTRCDIVDLTLNAKSLSTYGNTTGENAINVAFTTTNYSEFKTIGIAGFNIGVKVTSSSQIIHSNGIIFDSIAKGIEINTTTACTYKIQDATTFSGNPLSIDLLKCTGGGGLNFLLTNASFTIPIAGTGIKYTRADIVYNALSIMNCIHTNIGTGTFLSGFDFTNSADCNIEIISCIGEENKKPHAKINSIGNAGTTTITTAGTYYKDGYINSSSYNTKFTIANNKATFCSDHSNDIMIFVTGSGSVNANGRTLKYVLRKNSATSSTNYGLSTIKCATANDYYNFSLNAYFDDVKKDDYFELFVTSSTNGDVVLSNDINIMIVSM